MDDLLGEDWQAPSKPSTSIPTQALNPSTFASNYSSFRSSPVPPLSGTVSPQNISRPPSSVNGGAKASTGDSFGNLLSLKSQKQASNVSIHERQRQIAEEKRRQQEEQSQLWDNLGSRHGTPEIRGRSPAAPASAANEDEDDILAAFNKAAPVNKASHFPPPSSVSASRGSTPALPQPTQSFGIDDDDDDDPFGLGSMPQKRTNGHSGQSTRQTIDNNEEDDNLLGELGKPMVKRASTQAPSGPVSVNEHDTFSAPHDQVSGGPPGDAALAELIDMGFAEDSAQIALAENGGDVQHAVSWLLKQAHQESRAKAQVEGNERRRRPDHSTSPHRRHREEEALPSWSRKDRHNNAPPHRPDNRSPMTGDASQAAHDLGSKFLKGANSLWKASQKQMSKTMSEFQQDRDPGQPKWMQDAERSTSRSRTGAGNPDVTDEAVMLDAPRDRPSKSSRHTEQHALDRRPAEPLPHRPSPQPRFMQHPPPAQDKRPATKLSRHDVEEQSAQAYVSPARRKRPTTKPESQPEPEIDLFGPGPSAATSLPTRTVTSRPPSTRPSPAPPRPAPPPREVPNVSFSALATSAAHRKRGGEAFKRGDYASAHESYTAALTPIPLTHPIAIIILTNRALTALKTGDAKISVADASQALEIIGPGLGVGENIDLGGDEAPKAMREFYGKALTRKAEALEHLEKWLDAASAWRQAIEAGVGGSVALRGRDRCEKAAAPKPAAPISQAKAASAKAKAPTRAATAPPPKGLGNSMQRPTLTSATEAEAVRKLREANAAAEKADDERFQLADQVDARLTAWKGGKADNLRALLQSLDTVLWADAGWKKVGMSDLVMPNKVKIVYMKAIAKVHPDKISQDATTEQRMVSAAVFSTLNEAWDKFKKDNNL